MRTPVLSLALLALALPMQAQARDSVISVTISRSTRVAPNRAALYLTVEGNAETAADAVVRAEAKLKKVSDALAALGARVQLEPGLTFTVGPTLSPNGYPGVASPASSTARSAIRATVPQIGQLAVVMSTALDAGASASSSVTFESTLADSMRAMRAAEALSATRVEAEALARSLGGRLGTLVEVTSMSAPSFQQPASFNFDGRFGQMNQAPEVMVGVTVTARYRLVR